MTPRKAIAAECRQCVNTQTFKGCASEVCKLNRASLKPIKKIKAHCLTCCPEQSIYGVKSCDGKYIDGSNCVLHPFRLGKNPRRQAAGVKNAEQRGLFSFKFERTAAERYVDMGLTQKRQKEA